MKTQDLAATLNTFASLIESSRANELRALRELKWIMWVSENLDSSGCGD